MSFEVLAAGLRFPEGPIAMAAGSAILVEIARGTLSRVWNGKVEVVGDLGGGPNGAALSRMARSMSPTTAAANSCPRSRT
jgi:gluconolactonase